MAALLQSIYGTEQERPICQFYLKIGVCRFGALCSKLHIRPTESQTVMFTNMYQSPFNEYSPDGLPLFDQEEAQIHFEKFYEELFTELAQFGEIEELNVCVNVGDHLLGNVYFKFHEKEAASKVVENYTGGPYSGRPIVCDLSPVTDFSEAQCRQNIMGECRRGGYCGFMHFYPVPRELMRKLNDWQRKLYQRPSPPCDRSDTQDNSHDSKPRDDNDYRRRRERTRSGSRDSRGETRERSGRKRERSRSPERDLPESKRHESEQRHAKLHDGGSVTDI